MSTLRTRLSSRPMQRPAARRALERIREELQTIVDCHPDLGYDTDEERYKAMEAVDCMLGKIKWLYR